MSKNEVQVSLAEIFAANTNGKKKKNKGEAQVQEDTKAHVDAAVLSDVRYLQRGSALYQTSAQDMVLLDHIPVGTYTLMLDMERGFYLSPSDALKIPPKLYGNTQRDCDHFLAAFAARSDNTGVLLSGEKGSGKSLLGCVMSAELIKADVPTILINQAFRGNAFLTFIASIKQPCMVYFDEFEKVYNKEEGHQQELLTLLAGVYSGKKLFVFTSNDESSIDRHMLNRPGRIFYHLRYRGVDVETIQQYADEHLINKEHKQGLEIIASQVAAFNFDMLRSLIEEMNRFGLTAKEAIRPMNIRPEPSVWITYDGKLFHKGEEMDKKLYHCHGSNPMINGVSIRVRTDRKDIDGDAIWDNFEMKPADMKKFDYAEGVITFEKGKYRVEMTRHHTRDFEF